MKTIIFTTKDSEDCYQTIKENWFSNSTFIKVRTNSEIIDTSLQSEYNHVSIIENHDYRICLPECVNPQLKQKDKVEYIFSLICSLIKVLKTSKDDTIYLVIHSGDLFELKDARRETGHVCYSWLNCSASILSELQEMVEEKHIYQFRHDSNDISDLLLYPEKEDLIWFCKSLIEIIEE